MKLRDVVKWNSRMSAAYALGIWTMIGTYAFFRYTGHYQDPPVKKEEVEEPEDPTQVVYKTAHSKTVVTYKKDFVPYTTQIYNFISSFSEEGGGGDGSK